jgi:hypothetical protein
MSMSSAFLQMLYIYIDLYFRPEPQSFRVAGK